MAVDVILIRHAAHTGDEGALLGRTPDVALSAAGLRQAEALARRLKQRRIALVQSSPQLRARQTATPLAEELSLPIEIAPPFDEIDVGAWTGRSFAELAPEPAWRRWNSRRGSSRPPEGESMAELRDRVVDHLERLAADHPGRLIAIVSHAEPIRAAVLHYRGIPLDDFAAVAVDQASVTELRVETSGGAVLRVNQTIATLEPA